MSETITNRRKPAPIDFGKLWADIKKHRKLYYKVIPIVALMAVIITLSLPNYYNCTVMLAPESTTGTITSSSLSNIASSFGINLNSATRGADAITPTLYPDLMKSVDFKASLFPVKVTKVDGQEFTYYEYLTNEQKSPWWTTLMGWLSSLLRKESDDDSNAVNPYRLTKKQMKVVRALHKKITCDVNKKTRAITIQVTDQDPEICALVADSVLARLQQSITNYRTKKARVDLEYMQNLYKETKANYEKSSREYAEYADANMNTFLEVDRQKRADLEMNLQLQRNVYQQVAAQLQAAKAKVQEDTPAFTTLQSATVPVRKAGPKRSRMCLIALFMGIIGVTCYILYKENDIKPMLRMLSVFDGPQHR
ncbi:MAG: chain-length determining protein [Bacteroidaceae bacterium]|nr:chain-length determining protein [Bacteroidaceae bacterium]